MAYHADVDAALRERLDQLGILHNEAPAMLLAAAHGALKTGDIAEEPYQRRPGSMIEVILSGLLAR